MRHLLSLNLCAVPMVHLGRKLTFRRSAPEAAVLNKVRADLATNYDRKQLSDLAEFLTSPAFNNYEINKGRIVQLFLQEVEKQKSSLPKNK